MTHDASFVSVGPADYLRRFLAEYDLDEAAACVLIRRREVPIGPAGGVEIVYDVDASLLRSHGEFPCAGDAKALTFCRSVVNEMVRRFGIANAEAVARVNRAWSDPDDTGRVPRIWIVGLDILYHDTAEDWAVRIYYGDQPRWWDSRAGLQPMPPPD
ncbi:MAG TPA: hypothetical protein VFR11_01830 [Micromonosporaceae bacterium]|nr:hypothetical protein [Micromonosporaceae bacterium]